MNAPHANEIVGDYLSRLESALTNVPEPRRHELVEEVRSHIAEARLQLTEETDAVDVYTRCRRRNLDIPRRVAPRSSTARRL